MPKSKEKTPRIWVYWSKRERDLMINWDSETSGANPGYINGLFPPAVTKELDRRGYDITTLKFSIRKKVDYKPDDQPYVEPGPEEYKQAIISVLPTGMPITPRSIRDRLLRHCNLVPSLPEFYRYMVELEEVGAVQYWKAQITEPGSTRQVNFYRRLGADKFNVLDAWEPSEELTGE